MARNPDPVSELRRGTLELALLGFLAREANFGSGIMAGLAEATKGGMVLTEGALYPAVHRLEKNGLLTSEWRRDDPKAKKRKYYLLTKEGEERLALLKDAWLSLAKGMDSLFGGE